MIKNVSGCCARLGRRYGGWGRVYGAWHQPSRHSDIKHALEESHIGIS